MINVGIVKKYPKKQYVTEINNSLHVNFLFSKQNLDGLIINDIIEHSEYERE